MSIPLNIEENLFRKLDALSKARGTTIQKCLEEMIESTGFDPESAIPAKPERFVQKVCDLGAHIENPWTLLAELESEAYLKSYSRK